MPRRATAVFLLAVPVRFGLLWLGEIGGPLRRPQVRALHWSELGLPTNPIWPLAPAFALPVVWPMGASAS